MYNGSLKIVQCWNVTWGIEGEDNVVLGYGMGLSWYRIASTCIISLLKFRRD
ncbi:hypothetical protein BDZ94DRAFT_867430 [Collybia nuda]|uniref:Uncharacterized protein n=1 Tax=Collybia nuda TaxID=64659 RepID=A0A9P5Y404_9AGAR|nr:hypothetical protein BDZ94DRAFT_867430 [Collybia nuda]